MRKLEEMTLFTLFIFFEVYLNPNKQQNKQNNGVSQKVP